MDVGKAAIQILKRIPKNAASRAFGVVSEVEFPRPAQTLVNGIYAALMGVDVEESQAPPEAYASLNQFFTRRLRKGVRPLLTQTPQALVSPVDGRLGAFGRIDDGTLIQAKGRRYEILDLVDSAEEAELFSGGAFATIYLSPRDYHRIHAPVGGRVDKISYIPGHLFPVNPLAVRTIDELFAVNERLITYLNTPKLGRVAVVKVGATCVGRISLSFDPMETNGRLRRRAEFAPQGDFEFSAGEELATFNLGSTVIVLVQEQGFAFDENLAPGVALRMGMCLGRVSA